jgi:hypothetical protein
MNVRVDWNDIISGFHELCITILGLLAAAATMILAWLFVIVVVTAWYERRQRRTWQFRHCICPLLPPDYHQRGEGGGEASALGIGFFSDR